MSLPPASSLLPLLAVGGMWYHLSSRGMAIQTIWLWLNVFDTFRALRAVRPNGRRIGVNTRKKAMRDTLVCWIIFVVGQTVGPVVGVVLGWLPFYSLVKSVVCLGFLLSRVALSAHIFTNFLAPAIRPYETPIDLTILLFQSVAILGFHYLLQVPLSLFWTTLTYGGDVFSSLFSAARCYLSELTAPSVAQPISMINEPSTQHGSILDQSHQFRPHLSPPPTPRIPGSILLRHPTPKRPSIKGRKSIIIISPPATPTVVPPSPPSSTSEVIHLQTIPPSTPSRRTAKTQSGDPAEGLLGVSHATHSRRSPRKRKSEDVVEVTDLKELDLVATASNKGTNAREGKKRGAVESTTASNATNRKRRQGQDEAGPSQDAGSSDLTRNVSNSHVRSTTRRPANRGVIDLTNAFETSSSASTAGVTNNRIPPARASTAAAPSSAVATGPSKSTASRPRSANPSSGLGLAGTSKTTSRGTTTTVRTSERGKSPAKPKPRPRVLKASEGGVAHDKPLVNTAARSRVQARTRTKTGTQAAIDIDGGQKGTDPEFEGVVPEETKKVGQKRRIVSQVISGRNPAPKSRPATASASVGEAAAIGGPPQRKRARNV